MVNEIMNYGYTRTENENEYKKENWTIRFDNENIEVFNDPNLGEGLYYIADINKVDLLQLLSEIEEKIK